MFIPRLKLKKKYMYACTFIRWARDGKNIINDKRMRGKGTLMMLF